MAIRKKQIIALGGGGFSMEPDNLRLDQYILKQSAKKKPKVCFVPTASADSAQYTLNFYRSFSKLNCTPSDLSFYSPPSADISSYVLDKDIIYVGGGSTKNLLAIWKEWQLDDILRTAWTSGIILCGISAGSLCWFEEGITDSVPGPLSPISCLGFLPGSNCVHYDEEPARRPRYQQLIRSKKLSPGIAAADGVALHYIGTKLTHVVSSRADAKAYKVTLKNGNVSEEEIKPRFLK